MVDMKVDPLAEQKQTLIASTNLTKVDLLTEQNQTMISSTNRSHSMH